MGLIDSLNTKSKNHLGKQYERLEAMRLGKVPIRTGDVEKLYREVLNHLHKNWLQEVGLAFPTRPSKRRMGLPEQ